MRAGQEHFALLSLYLISRYDLVPAELVVDGAESKRWNLNVLNLIAQRHPIIIFLKTFISKHLQIDVLVDMIQSCFVSFNSVTQLEIVFLRHHLLEVW